MGSGGGGAGGEHLSGPLASSAVSTRWASSSRRSSESRTEMTSPSCWLGTRQIWRHSARSGTPTHPPPHPPAANDWTSSQSGRLLLVHLLRLLMSGSSSGSLGPLSHTPLDVLPHLGPSESTALHTGVLRRGGWMEKRAPPPGSTSPNVLSCPLLLFLPGPWPQPPVSPRQSISHSGCPSPAHTPPMAPQHPSSATWPLMPSMILSFPFSVLTISLYTQTV